nr:4399_t:CDS:10 [Entrophospora candida]
MIKSSSNGFISTSLSLNENNSNKTSPSSNPEDSTSKTLKSNSVENYWNDVENYTRITGFPPRKKINDLTDLENMRKLITETISSKANVGDLLPCMKAKEFCEVYENLDKQNKKNLLNILARDFDSSLKNLFIGVPREEAIKSATSYIQNTRAVFRAEQILRHTLTPVYNVFFDRVNQLPDGTKFLIDMRADLLEIIHEDSHEIYLTALNESLKEKLTTWILGFLDLKRITWYSHRTVLEKLKNYEAVHSIKDWDDFKRRVGPDRRLFAFFFRGMPHEPLVFINVALKNELSNNIQEILEEPEPDLMSSSYFHEIKHAIFYSITSQPGLSGIELGNFLIKRVVRVLHSEFPSIETFSTLSPIPRFRKWLITRINIEKNGIFINNEEGQIKFLKVSLKQNDSSPLNINKEVSEKFKEILSTRDWINDEKIFFVLKPILLRLCARYILTEKHRTFALDPVANFHIRNGACVHRLNWLGDVSEKGLNESFGMMINYNYFLDYIETNNQKYMSKGTITLLDEDPVLVEEAKRENSNIHLIKPGEI